VRSPLFYLFSRAVVALLATGVVACSPGALEAPALRAYVQDPTHGLVQRTTVGGAEVVCTYRPTGLLVAQELANQPTSEATLDSVRQAFATKRYFSLSLSQGGTEIENQYVTEPATFANTLAYLNTGIAEDVFLVTAAQDSVPALASTYPRQYGSTGRSTVLLIFDASRLPLNQDFHLTFRADRFGLGTLRFPFTAADLADVPQLKLPQ
jgi:hypothetical protein